MNKIVRILCIIQRLEERNKETNNEKQKTKSVYNKLLIITIQKVIKMEANATNIMWQLNPTALSAHCSQA